MSLKALTTIKVCIVTYWVICSSCGAVTDEQLRELVKSAVGKIQDFSSVHPQLAPSAKKNLDGLTDAQKLRGFSLLLMSLDENPQEMSAYSGTRLKMSAYSGTHITRTLFLNPGLIQDETELRKMISKEDDPRRFFHLSNMGMALTRAMQVDFIPQQFRMLFRDGRVAQNGPEDTPNWAHDVSVYTFKWIVGTLDLLNAGFEEPEKKLPHEEQAMILANWLIQNWPGCEHLTIPDEGSPRRPLAERIGNNLTSTQASSIGTKNDLDDKETKEAYRWIMIAAVVLLVLSLTVWWKIRVSKS